MPQKYQVELPDGSKYEVEEPQGESFAKETGKGIKEFGKTMFGAVEGIPQMMRVVAGAPNKEDVGMLMGVGEAASHPLDTGKAMLQDATIGGPKLSTGEHIGHTAANAAMLLGPMALSKASKAAKIASEASKMTQHGLPLLGGPVSELGAQEALLGAAQPKPAINPATLAAKTGTGAETPNIIRPSGGFGQARTFSQPPTGGSAANAAMKAEQAATTQPTPYREPIYPGAEKRGAGRVVTPAMDKAYKQVRAEIEKKAAVAKARAELGGGKKPAPVAAKTPAEPTVSEPLAQEPVVSQHKPSETLVEGGGMTPGKKTTSLADMKAKYGLDEAAKRAGMPTYELEARIEAEASGKPIEEVLARKKGARRTNQLLGTKLESTKRLPDEAVSQIKAAHAKLRAEGKPLTPAQEALESRITKEAEAARLAGNPSGEVELGAGVPIPKKLRLPLGGALAGGVAGYGLGGGDSDEKLGKGALGALAGGLSGAAALNLPKAIQAAMGVRRESLLSGMAIPKNMMQMAGNALYAAAENKNPASIKELFRLPKNFKEYASAMKEGDPYSHSTLENYGPGAGKSHLRFVQPSHHIGAIDKTDVAMLKRMGVKESDLPRYMMNADQDVLRTIVNHPDIPEALRPTVKIMARIGFPFTRFATNQLAGTAREVAQIVDSVKNLDPTMRTALNIGSIGGGAMLGQWAGNDPKKRLIATTLLPLFGPSQGLATLAAIATQGARGLGGGAFGGLSPLPEQGMNPAQFVNPKQWFGFKPAALNAAEKLGGK